MTAGDDSDSDDDQFEIKQREQGRIGRMIRKSIKFVKRMTVMDSAVSVAPAPTPSSPSSPSQPKETSGLRPSQRNGQDSANNSAPSIRASGRSQTAGDACGEEPVPRSLLVEVGDAQQVLTSRRSLVQLVSKKPEESEIRLEVSKFQDVLISEAWKVIFTSLGVGSLRTELASVKQELEDVKRRRNVSEASYLRQVTALKDEVRRACWGAEEIPPSLYRTEACENLDKETRDMVSAVVEDRMKDIICNAERYANSELIVKAKRVMEAARESIMEENGQLQTNMEEVQAQVTDLKGQLEAADQSLKMKSKDLDTIQGQYERSEFECTKLRVKLRKGESSPGPGSNSLQPSNASGGRVLKHANSDVGRAHVCDLLEKDSDDENEKEVVTDEPKRKMRHAHTMVIKVGHLLDEAEIAAMEAEGSMEAGFIDTETPIKKNRKQTLATPGKVGTQSTVRSRSSEKGKDAPSGRNSSKSPTPASKGSKSPEPSSARGRNNTSQRNK